MIRRSHRPSSGVHHPAAQTRRWDLERTRRAHSVAQLRGSLQHEDGAVLVLRLSQLLPRDRRPTGGCSPASKRLVLTRY